MYLIKKTLTHPKACKDERPIFQEKIKTYEAAGFPIVYSDKSGFAHEMPRTHGYAPIGKRCFGIKDWHAKGRTNVIAALVDKLLLTVALFDTYIKADIFYAWVRQDLLPKLKKRCVIVLDNATFHKRQDRQDALRKAGHILLFLPPYSPDLNKIEPQWAQDKTLRKQNHRSINELFTQYIL